jgi:YARHG domain
MKIFINTIIFPLAVTIVLFASCKDAIKNNAPKLMIEEGTRISVSKSKIENTTITLYVGNFEPDLPDSIASNNAVSAGEAFYWDGANKISIVIKGVKKDSIIGYSVVAGLQRNFAGTIVKTETGQSVIAYEPGDDKYDGTFIFAISDTAIIGTWRANKNVGIDKRKYVLHKNVFKYNANQLLDSVQNQYSNNRYIDWTKPKLSATDIKNLKIKMTSQEKNEYEEFEENTEFSSASSNIFTINASANLLTEKVVSNLKKGDLTIIRNTIYARHGYSFKYKPLRVFFDMQGWYIPASIDVKNQLTEIEKQNIQLLLRYEKNAKEYYDYFGRS